MTLPVLLAFAVTICAFVVIFGSALYDFQAAGQKRFLKIVTSVLHRTAQPPVTVLLYADADKADELSASLRSIWRSRYHQYDVVVVVHGSRQLLRQLQTQCQTASRGKIRWCVQPRSHSRLAALRHGYRRSQRGELALVLVPGDVLPPQLLKAAVAQFVADETVSALRLRRRVTPALSLESITIDYLEASRNIVYKARSVTRQSRVMLGEPAAMYQAALLDRAPAKETVRGKWASTLVVSMPGSSPWRPRLDVLFGVRLAAGLLAVILGAVVMYRAATLISSVWLIVSWLFVSVGLAAVCFLDDAMPPSRRLTMFVSIPPLYFVLYVRLIVWCVRAFAAIVTQGSQRAKDKSDFMRKFSYTAHERLT